MNVQILHDFIATVPGSMGDHFARNIGITMIASGNINAVAALVDMLGLTVITALVRAEASPAVLRTAIEHAVMFHYRELPDLIAAQGGRAVFATWCRAAFTIPADTPDVVSIYRGTIGVPPAVAAQGLHWAFEFDKASYYAAKFADTDLTGVIVLHARVPRTELVASLGHVVASEIIPADVPTTYEVITDHGRIGDAAVRHAHRLENLLDQGWRMFPTHGTAERVATEARARMVAAGVPRGTAIVA